MLLLQALLNIFKDNENKMARKLELNFSGILEKRLPSREIDFLSHQLSPMVPELKSSSLNDVLLKVSSLFNAKSYGCEESILSGKAIRWPSEINMQRYCGEQVLANWLSSLSLNLLPVFLHTENFKGRGMNHAVVLVPEKNHFLMLDWNQVSSVQLRGEKLVDKSGKVISESAFEIDPALAFDRINSLRRRSVFDSIGKLELLTRESTGEGEIEALQGRNFEKGELSFEYISSEPHSLLAPYYLQTFTQRSNSIGREEAGLIYKRTGYNYQRIPVLRIRGGNMEFLPFYRDLAPDAKQELLLSVLYRIKRDENHSALIFSNSERQNLLKGVNTVSKEGDKETRRNTGRQINFYHSLKSHSEASAQTYLDSLCLKSFFLAEHSHDTFQTFSQITGIETMKEVGLEFVRSGLDKLQELYFDKRQRKSAEAILLQQFTGRKDAQPERKLIEAVRNY